jgi:tetratricopeptide (TPR) repeat protein
MSLKVIEGKDGWLFLHNDTNKVIDQVTGKKFLDQEEVKIWEKELADRQAHAKSQGYKYLFLIIPNKHCIYSEYLPNEYVLSDKRPAIQLKQASALVYYPDEDLLNYKKMSEVYHKTDTHWNNVGASLVYNNLAAKLSIDARINIDISTSKILGDLGSKMIPARYSTEYTIELPDEGTVIFNNKVHNIGGVIVHVGPDKSLPCAVVFGDSFVRSSLVYLGQFFSKVYFFHTPVYDKKLVEAIKPDVVISANVERFIYKWNPVAPTFLGSLLDKLGSFMNIPKSVMLNVDFNGYESFFQKDELDAVKALKNDWIKLFCSEKFGSIDFTGDIDLNQCLDIYKYGLEQGINVPAFYGYIFDRLVDLKKYDDAILVMNSSIKMNGKIAQSHVSLSNAFVYKRKFSEAIPCVIKALEIDSENCNYLNHLSNIYRMSGDFVNAELAAKRSIEINDKIAQSFISLSNALIGQKKFSEAISSMIKALEIDPENCYYLNKLSDIYRMAGDPLSAETVSKRSIQLNDTIPQSFISLSNALVARKKFSEAIDCILKALNIDSTNCNYLNHLSNVYKISGDFFNAESVAKKSIQINDAIPQSFISLSNALIAQEKFQDAITCLRKALDLDPKNADYLNRLNKVCRQSGDTANVPAASTK